MIHGRTIALFLVGSIVIGSDVATSIASEPSVPPASGNALTQQAEFQRFVESNCLNCHDNATKAADLALDALTAADLDQNQEVWEKVIRKLSARQMPPAEMPKPSEQEFATAIAWLESSLNAASADRPNPGRTETFRRLNRTEYQNAIRDLLALEVDSTQLLPPDESSQGFDNITVANLSPALLNSYLSAAQKISRLAVGRAPRAPSEDVFRMRPDVTQDVHAEGLPIGTRGGMAISHNFPQDGLYEIRVRLMRDRNDEVESIREPHELEMLLDRDRVGLFTVKPPGDGATHQNLDAHLKAEINTTAGPHDVGVTFIEKSASLQETMRQPLNVHFNFNRHPRLGPAVYQVSIIGPIEARGPGDTPSRRKLFICTPKSPADEEDCARQILANVARRAYRRPLNEDDLKTPLKFYRAGRMEGDFEAGIEQALSSVLINPQFLLRIERDPVDVTPATAYRIDDVELASRLSFFLWSSIPDEELLDLASRGELGRPEVLDEQLRRMLADKRSQSLVNNFAEQWLYLRNLDAVNPDMRLFPDFDDNLRQAMREETELFFASIVRENRSVLDLLKADYTYLNERLAKHYGVPHVYGSHFRRVSLDEGSRRGGLLRQGSILTVTSYATRTSPVLRGQWVLKNLVGAPPPPPPPDVPALEESTVSGSLSVRERLKQHRTNEACAVCHNAIDPVGFALENFDAVGRWRNSEADHPVDATGGFLDGSEFVGVSGLEHALLNRPELFVRTLTEKLITFALGRGVEYYDAPAIRKIVGDARDEDYRFSELILGIARSTPFQMRMSP